MAEPGVAPSMDARNPFDLVHDVPIENTGRWNVSLRDVSLRPYPFPYAAGFALANENSYANEKLFESVHALVNGRASTPFGDGLGLEVGDSLVLSETGFPRLCTGSTDPGHADRVERLVDAGWIDSLYSPIPEVTRGLAATLAGWRPNDWPSVFLGPASPCDRAFLRKAGVCFFGDDTWTEIAKFGDHHDHKIAERFRLAAADYDWSHPSGEVTGADVGADVRTLIALMNQTLHAVGGDETRAFGFKRYRGPWLPSMPTFSAQATGELLDRLTQLAGVVIVQQQLGRWSLVGAADGACQARPNAEPALDHHAVAAWRDIAERNAGGMLWVATTARLLDYLRRRQSLVFTVDKTPERWVITLHEHRCPVMGRRAVETSDLNGLGFTVGEATPEVVVTVAGWGQPVRMNRDVDPAHRYRHAVYRPWIPLEWLEP